MTLAPADIRALLGRTPAEAVSYLRHKGLAITWNWHDLWDQAHDRAFTVAKATHLDLLKDLKDAVTQAVAEGRTGREFARELEPLLRAKGWWGKELLTDPASGAQRLVQTGSPHRLKTIYDTNTAAAYNAGRLAAQSQDPDRPYLMYVAVMDSVTRPAHAALHGKVWPADDPIWQHLYPPNDYNCRCRVEAYSAAELAARNLSPVKGGRLETREEPVGRDGVLRPVSTWYGPNKERVRIAPGFDHAPQAWPLDHRGGLDDCPTGLFADHGACCRLLPGQQTWQDHGRPDARTVPQELRLPDPGLLPAAADRGAAMDQLRQALGLPAEGSRRIATPVGLVLLRAELLTHLVAKTRDQRERYARYILPTLEQPWEVYLTEYDDGSWRERFIGLFTGRADLLAVVLRNRDGSLLWNIMQARDKDLNKHRVGALLWPR